MGRRDAAPLFESFRMPYRSVASGILLALIAGYALTADALCIYGGRLYAKTTLEQEFRDSAVVIEAKVISSRDTFEDDEPGVVYRINIERWFKGTTPGVIEDFSERDSGGFYLNVGTDYLLFLNPISDEEAAANPSWRNAAPDAMMVNYNCGQSRPWANVALEDRRKLAALSQPSP
jgi:hypothetical protein